MMSFQTVIFLILSFYKACHRELETLNADTFAVSGPRKVAAFLFKNRKRIRIYDMEIEEEDEDEDTFANSGLSSDLNTSY